MQQLEAQVHQQPGMVHSDVNVGDCDAAGQSELHTLT